LEILGPILDHSSVTASQNSSDLASYAINKAPPKHQQPSNEKSQDTKKKLALKIRSSGTIVHTRSPRESKTREQPVFETDFKTLIKKLGNREKIVPQRLDKRNTLKSHGLTHLHRAH
jgi:hypothetical protein